LYLGKEDKINHDLITDWESYQLILFNILQNAVKYNRYSGDIIIKISLKSLDNSHAANFAQKTTSCSKKQKYDGVLETEVIDSGIGIVEYR